eukprot:363378-Chlamydomonas_euryale.AAC.8
MIGALHSLLLQQSAPTFAASDHEPASAERGGGADTAVAKYSRCISSTNAHSLAEDPTCSRASRGRKISPASSAAFTTLPYTSWHQGLNKVHVMTQTILLPSLAHAAPRDQILVADLPRPSMPPSCLQRCGHASRTLSLRTGGAAGDRRMYMRCPASIASRLVGLAPKKNGPGDADSLSASAESADTASQYTSSRSRWPKRLLTSRWHPHGMM